MLSSCCDDAFLLAIEADTSDVPVGVTGHRRNNAPLKRPLSSAKGISSFIAFSLSLVVILRSCYSPPQSMLFYFHVILQELREREREKVLISSSRPISKCICQVHV